MKAADDTLNRALDQALEMTFPASDPIAVYIPDTWDDYTVGVKGDAIQELARRETDERDRSRGRD